jgi:hypothetical protein
MARFIFIALITLLFVLGFLGVMYLKDSYKLLPIQSSKDVTAAPFADWHDFRSPKGKFNVMMPALPQHASQTVRDPKTNQLRNYEMYVAEKADGSIFMVSLIRFPESKTVPEEVQKTVVNDLLTSNPTNQLKDMKIGDYRQFKTLDFSIVNSDTTIDGMTFIDGDTLFLLSGVFHNKNYQPTEYEYFIKSFDLSPSLPAEKDRELPESLKKSP